MPENAILDEAPQYVHVFRANWSRWPTLDEMESEHNYLLQRALEIYDRGCEDEKRGASRTHVAALYSDFTTLKDVLEESRKYLEDVRARCAANRERCWIARERRWARLLRQAYGYVPD